jgi:cyclic dehypoxanthinyl futalosine synthase
VGLRETIGRLRDAGLDSMPGGIDGCGLAAWVEVHRTSHVLGVPTSAEMVFGAGETIEDRLDFLEAVRRLQEETGGFAAFVPVGFRPAGRDLDGTTAVEGLKTLAISRMFLDNIDNVQADRAGQSLKVLQTALRFGANDAGAVRHGRGPSGSEEDLRRVIRDAGFVPAERNAAYRMMFLGV